MHIEIGEGIQKCHHTIIFGDFSGHEVAQLLNAFQNSVVGCKLAHDFKKILLKFKQLLIEVTPLHFKVNSRHTAHHRLPCAYPGCRSQIQSRTEMLTTMWIWCHIGEVDTGRSINWDALGWPRNLTASKTRHVQIVVCKTILLPYDIAGIVVYGADGWAVVHILPLGIEANSCIWHVPPARTRATNTTSLHLQVIWALAFLTSRSLGILHSFLYKTVPINHTIPFLNLLHRLKIFINNSLWFWPLLSEGSRRFVSGQDFLVHILLSIYIKKNISIV